MTSADSTPPTTLPPAKPGARRWGVFFLIIGFYYTLQALFSIVVIFIAVLQKTSTDDVLRNPLADWVLLPGVARASAPPAVILTGPLLHFISLIILIVYTARPISPRFTLGWATAVGAASALTLANTAFALNHFLTPSDSLRFHVLAVWLIATLGIPLAIWLLQPKLTQTGRTFMWFQALVLFITFLPPAILIPLLNRQGGLGAVSDMDFSRYYSFPFSALPLSLIVLFLSFFWHRRILRRQTPSA
jgi:hypothetical protein